MAMVSPKILNENTIKLRKLFWFYCLVHKRMRQEDENVTHNSVDQSFQSEGSFLLDVTQENQIGEFFQAKIIKKMSTKFIFTQD